MKLLLAALLCLTHSVIAQGYTNSVGEWYFWNDSTRIYARTMGSASAEPVVVLHGGFGAEHSYLIPALRPLFPSHKFVFYDQRGSLRSPAENNTISLNSMVDDLERLRQELRVQQLTLVTHSMGAVTAYAYLKRYPENVRKIVFVAPVFPFYPGTAPDKEMLQQLDLPSDESNDTVKQILSGLSKQAAAFDQNAKVQMRREGLDHEPQDAQERTAQWLISFASANIYDISKWRQMRGGQAFYNGQVYPLIVEHAGGAEAYRQSWKPYFASLAQNSKKLTFIIGKNDFIDGSYQFWPLIFKQLPGASVVAIDEAGHNIWIDQPDEFAAALSGAL